MTIELDWKMGIQPRMDTDEHRWTGWASLVSGGRDFNAKTQSRRDARKEKGWTELVHSGSSFAKATVGDGQILPVGARFGSRHGKSTGIRRLASRCVMANSPEYVTLEGPIHRDSPQYVTKKICSLKAKRVMAHMGASWRLRALMISLLLQSAAFSRTRPREAVRKSGSRHGESLGLSRILSLKNG